VPHVWYLHEFVTEDHGLIWQYGERFSYWLVDKLSQIVLVNSLIIKAKAERFIHPTKIRFLYYATEIDWAPFEDAELPQEPILLMAGAVQPGKNQELAIRALAEPALRDIQAKLRIVGACQDTEKERLIALAQTLGVADRIEFFPFSTDRRGVFSKGRALIVASRAEAFGRVTVEAQKSGLPVLLANAGSAPELVEHGETGLLFDLHDPKDLALQASNLLTNNNLYLSIKTKALLQANNRYNLPTHGALLVKYLREALHGYVG
jgi:glycosyltransferase involved in cell wall biosynthesis